MRARDRSSHRSGVVEAQEDARLVAGAAAGDRQMFATLYHRHLDAVFARLTRVIGPVPERDDLVQNIFLDVHRALPNFRGDASFSTFLHRIVINVAYEFLGRQRNRRGTMLPLDDQQLDNMIDPEDSPETRARQHQELAWAWTNLGALSPKRRIAFVLVVIDELSLDEAAALVDASADAVKQRVIEARRELNKNRVAFEDRQDRPKSRTSWRPKWRESPEGKKGQ
jgi:RNA polymerase sigma-70 factor (ECF subfamily)